VLINYLSLVVQIDLYLFLVLTFRKRNIMKKTLLATGILCFTSLSVFAQSMSIKEMGTSTDVSGTTHVASATSSTMLIIDFDVYNEGAMTDNFIITRRILSQPTGWENEVCWGAAGAGSCYPNNPNATWSTPQAISLAPGIYGSLTLHIIPNQGFNNYALYRYYTGTVASPKMDSIDVVVNQSLSIKELKRDVSLTVSPNPASDNVLIKVNNFEKGNLKIVDVLGNVVKTENFYGSKSVDVSDFRNGVYFILITGDGVNSINRKLVVKH
jgi:hypothetical protein